MDNTLQKYAETEVKQETLQNDRGLTNLMTGLTETVNFDRGSYGPMGLHEKRRTLSHPRHI